MIKDDKEGNQEVSTLIKKFHNPLVGYRNYIFQNIGISTATHKLRSEMIMTFLGSSLSNWRSEIMSLRASSESILVSSWKEYWGKILRQRTAASSSSSFKTVRGIGSDQPPNSCKPIELQRINRSITWTVVVLSFNSHPMCTFWEFLIPNYMNSRL